MSQSDDRFRLVDEANAVIVGIPGPAGPAGQSVSVTSSEEPPIEPFIGDVWFQLIDGARVPYIFDGIEWLALTGPPGPPGSGG